MGLYYEDVIDDVKAERDFQDKKWGDDRNLPDDLWLRVLVEEVGEVANAMFSDNDNNIDDELVQVAAVAVAWLENIRSR